MQPSKSDYKNEGTDNSHRIIKLVQNYHIPSLITAISLGLICSFLIVINPIIGVGFVFGLIVYVLVCNNPELAFCILVFSFAIPIQKKIAGFPLNLTDATIVLWGMAWPFLMIKKISVAESLKTNVQNFNLPTVVWLTSGVVATAFISLIGAENFGGSLKQAIRLVEWLIVLPILFMSIQDKKFFWTIATFVFLFIPPLFALDGVIEVINNGRSLSQMLGIPVPIPSEEHSEIKHTFDVSGRAGSTFGGAQGLAMYLTMMMAPILSIIIKPQKPSFRFLGLCAFAVCIAGMVFAKSRGGLLGCLVMMSAIFLVAYPRITLRIMIVAGIALALALIGFLVFYGWDGTIAGLIPGRVEAALDRLIIWERALRVFVENPINGVGFGGFRDNVYNNEPLPLYVGLGYESLHSHNTYLEVLTGTGIIGFTAYITFLIVTWKKLLSAWKNRLGLGTDCFILAAIGGLAAYMMFGMVDMLFLQNMHMVLVSLLSLGFIAAQRAPKAKDNYDEVNI